MVPVFVAGVEFGGRKDHESVDELTGEVWKAAGRVDGAAGGGAGGGAGLSFATLDDDPLRNPFFIVVLLLLSSRRREKGRAVHRLSTRCAVDFEASSLALLAWLQRSPTFASTRQSDSHEPHEPNEPLRRRRPASPARARRPPVATRLSAAHPRRALDARALTRALTLDRRASSQSHRSHRPASPPPRLPLSVLGRPLSPTSPRRAHHGLESHILLLRGPALCVLRSNGSELHSFQPTCRQQRHLRDPGPVPGCLPRHRRTRLCRTKKCVLAPSLDHGQG